MTIRNRELSQFGSFVYVENSTQEIGITTSPLPFVGIGTTNPQYKLHVTGGGYFEGTLISTCFSGNLSGSADYATSSGVATYSSSSGVATYSNNAGIATYSSFSGIATYSSNSGIATYAGTSGVSTNVIGGIGSVTSLQVTGLSTFTNGPVLIGSGTLTGTASQTLQVTGSSYISGSLGIGTTNPKVTLDVSGNANISGVVTALSFSGDGSKLTNLPTGIVTYATNAGTATTVIGGIGSITSLSVSGISTLGFTTISQLYVGVSTFSGIATHTAGLFGTQASFSGIVTSPTFSGNLSGTATTATNVIGGIGSITQLQVSGVSTFSSNPVLIGSATSTGTASQRLQVTGGAYISGNLGIGTTSSNYKLHLVGDTNITGIVSATGYYLNGNPLVSAYLNTWDLNGSNVYRNTGNVGIGSSVPTSKLQVIGDVSADRIISTVATGTAPFVVSSATQVSNLNASLLGGKSAPSGDIVGTSDSQTLSNKTLTSPVISSIVYSGTTSNLPAVNGTLVSTGSTAVVTNNMIAASAGIPYSKLSLSNSITNADIASNAGILTSKLSAYTISGVNLGSNLKTLSAGTYMTGGSYNGSADVTFGVSATSSNTASTIVARDGSGNFTAGTITCDYLKTNGGSIGVSVASTGNLLQTTSTGIQWTSNNFYDNVNSRMMLGTSTYRTIDGYYPTGVFYNEGAGTGHYQVFAGICNRNDTSGPQILLGKSRGTTLGSNTVVQNGDGLGTIKWVGADGTDLSNEAANIGCEVDNVPGSNDMPGRIVISTSPDGTATPIKRVWITSGGYFKATNKSDGNPLNSSGTYHELLTQNSSSNNTVFYASNASYAAEEVLFGVNRLNSNAYKFIACYSSAFSASDAEFTFFGDGNAFADGSWTGGGADYAEMFEWTDGNLNEEDRRGFTVVLDGKMIRPAVDGEEPIGVISGNPTVVGDSAWNKWSEKYLKDDFGTYIREEHVVYEWTDSNNKFHSYESINIPEGIIIPEDAVVKTHDDNGVRFTHRKLNPEYDPTLEYIPRKDRKEWDAVGLMGKLRIRKGQPVGSRWIKLCDISKNVEEWLIR